MMQFMACVECWRDVRLNHVSPGGLCPVCSGIEGQELVLHVA